MVQNDGGGWVKVRVWLFGFVSFMATLGTIISAILLYTVGPIKQMAQNNHDDVIRIQSENDEMKRRIKRNEEVLDVLHGIQTDINVIKNEIEHLKQR